MSTISTKNIVHCPLCMHGKEFVSLGNGVLRCNHCGNAFQVHYPPQKEPSIDPEDPFPMALKKPKQDDEEVS